MLYLLLHAGPERLAVPAAGVVEVLPAVERHPAGGREVIVRRGAVVPVLDLCRQVGGAACPHTLHARLVVVAGPLGLLVERVGDLVELAGPGPLVADPGGVVRLLDPARLTLPEGAT